MDVTDIATNYETTIREAQVANARHPVESLIARRRRLLAEAREIAAQRGTDDPEVQALELECANNCGTPLTVEDEDAFCCPECLADWQKRDQFRQRTNAA